MWVRIAVVAAYLAVFGCGSAINATVKAVEVTAQLVRAISSASNRRRPSLADRAYAPGGESPPSPDYDTELIEPHVPPGYGDDVPEGHFRTERGSRLEPPRPARR